jgi:hypothetical protein
MNSYGVVVQSVTTIQLEGQISGKIPKRAWQVSNIAIAAYNARGLSYPSTVNSSQSQ